MKSLKTFTIVLVALAISLPVTVCAAEKVFELSFTSDGYRENHQVTQQAFMPWFKDLEKRSNGRLKVVYYSPGTLCGFNEVFDSAEKGRVDIAHSLYGSNPGRFAYSDIGNANISTVNTVAGSLAFYDYLWNNQWIKDEIDKPVKLLTVWATPPMRYASNKPIHSLADLKGMKIGYHSAGADKIISCMEAVPVLVPPTDIYMSIQRGQTNATFMGITIMKSFKLFEVMPYTLDYPMAPAYHFIVMNREVWNGLPKELQELIEQTTGLGMCERISHVMDDSIEADYKWMLANKKQEMLYLNEGEGDKFAALLKPFTETWIADTEKRGYPRAREAMEIFEKAVAKQNAVAANKNQN